MRHISQKCCIPPLKVQPTFLFKKPTKRTNYPNLFFYKTLRVSGIFSAHHQEFSTVHSALVSLMPVFDDRFQAQSGWNCSSILTVVNKNDPNARTKFCVKVLIIRSSLRGINTDCMCLETICYKNLIMAHQQKNGED